MRHGGSQTILQGGVAVGGQGEGAGGRGDGRTGVKSQKCTFLVSISCCELRYYNTSRYIGINLIKFKRNARLHECTAIICFRNKKTMFEG